MTVHFYFMPVINLGEGPEGGRGPKYLRFGSNTSEVSCPWGMIDYGHIDVALLAADTTLAQHQYIFDKTDVLSIDPRTGVPRDLDQLATQAEVNALTTYLDNAGNFCPMDWADTSDTRRAILRGVCGMFLFIQNVTGILAGGTPKDWGITLDTTWTDLSSQQQSVLLQAATNLGYQVQVPAPTTRMRAILRYMAQQWGEKPIYISPAVL